MVGGAEASMSMWALSGIDHLRLGRNLGRPGLSARKARASAGDRTQSGTVGHCRRPSVSALWLPWSRNSSTHLSQGPTAVFLNWSPYVLLLSGAAAMFLASNAFQAGSLAASQPGLTIVDPLVAGALGVVLFGESLRHNPLVLSGEVLAVALVIASVIMLSQSPLVQDEGPAEVRSARTGACGEGRRRTGCRAFVSPAP